MKRQGKTGTWKFVLETQDGKVIAIPDWSPSAKEYTFHKAFWEVLPIVP